MAYITVAELKQLPVGVKFAALPEETLEEFIEIASENVENHTERKFTSAYYTDEFYGDGTAVFVVEQYPVIRVVSMKQIDPVTSAETIMLTTSVSSTSSDLGAGILRLSSTATVPTFSSSYKYQIYYQAGYTTVPYGIKHATRLWAAELMQPDYAGVQNGVSDVIPLTSEQIIELLDPYKRRRI
jgi:hypothetical protein